MKFTDGNWLMREGVKPHYAVEAYDVESDGQTLTIHAPTRPVRQRGDTLQGPLLAVRLSSPMPDVIRVTISHFEGGEGRWPEFELIEDPNVSPAVELTDDLAALTSGKLSVRIPRADGWRMDFVADGKVVTSSPARGIGYMEVEGEGAYVHEQLSIGVGESVYGLGERFTAFVKNGQALDTWNRDGGTGSDQAYKCVPFYLTNRGYGVFVNEPGRVDFEVASEKVSRVQFSIPGESLEYFVIYGPTPKEVLSKYTALTGRPALPPAWSFGLWLSTSFTTSYDEGTVTSFIQGMADRDLPLSVFHFDCFWMKEFHWCDFHWDERVFPNPPAMLQRLKERGLRICVWINPYIAQRSPLFVEGKQNGFLLTRPDGSVWQWDLWQPGMAIVDFTNPAACEWFSDKLEVLLDMGVDCFKTDFGERIPTDVDWSDAAEPERMHNYYSFLYNKVVFDLLERKRGAGEAVLFARAGTAGSQRFPVHWGGDCNSSFESMAESLRGGLSLGLSGFGFWSHDIGGFEGTPPADVYKRWIAFGLLSSHSRLHGSSSYRVPWLFDEEAVDALRFFTKLKCRLMPYLYSKAVEAHETGDPVMRAMVLEFPEDPACATLDRQYMLGDSLLVAPVLSSDGTVEYWVPEGRWTNFITGEVIAGPKWLRERHGFLSLPLLVRPNTILATGSTDSRPDYDYTAGTTLEVYGLDDGAEIRATLVTQDGRLAAAATTKRNGSRITVNVEGALTDWRVLVVGTGPVKSEGYSVENTSRGAMVIPRSGANRIELELI